MDAFLSLCQLGAIRGVVKGDYTRSILNRGYVERALDEIKISPQLKENEAGLWAIVTGNSGIKHNQQLDVVISLINNGNININA